MPTNTLENKAHELISRLGPGQLAALVQLLETMIDGEELTEQDRSAIAESREYFRAEPEGGISFEQMVAECGFTMDQVLGKE